MISQPASKDGRQASLIRSGFGSGRSVHFCLVVVFVGFIFAACLGGLARVSQSDLHAYGASRPTSQELEQGTQLEAAVVPELPAQTAAPIRLTGSLLTPSLGQFVAPAKKVTILDQSNSAIAFGPHGQPVAGRPTLLLLGALLRP